MHGRTHPRACHDLVLLNSNMGHLSFPHLPSLLTFTPACRTLPQARKTYHEALIEVQQRTLAKNRLVGMIGKEDKLAAAEAAVAKAQEAAEECRKEYDAVSARLLRDFER